MSLSHHYFVRGNLLAFAVIFCSLASMTFAQDKEVDAESAKRMLKVKEKNKGNSQKKDSDITNATETQENSNVFTLGTLTITGTPSSSAEETESVIDKDKINLFEKKDVGTALSKVPGVLYNYAQGGRYESNVFVRGYGLRYMPIYIDGIPVYIPYDGYSDLGRFTTADISSIHVAKGYSSVMYGHNTMGGAINIVTMKPRSELDVTGTLGIGQGDSKEENINVGSLQDKWYIQMGASNLSSRYTNLSKSFVGKDSAGRLIDSKKYAYTTKDRRGSIKLGLLPNETDEYAVSYSKQKAKKYPSSGVGGFEPTTWEWPKWDRETLSYVSNTYFLDDKFYIKPRVYEDRFKNTLIGFGGSRNGSHYDDKAFGSSVELGTSMISHNQLKLLLSYKREKHSSFNTYEGSSIKIPGESTDATQKFYSIALEDTINFNDYWEAQFGIIHTKRKASATGIGNNTAALIQKYPEVNSMLAPTIRTTDPEAALFYKPTKDHTFRASIARKTRFPSFKEAYSNYSSGSTGKCPSGQSGCTPGQIIPRVTLQNPGLKPENAMNYEIGYSGMPIDGMTVEAALFLNQAKKAISRTAIDYNNFPGYAITQTTNLPGVTERKGFELGVDYVINNKLIVGGTYTFLRARNKSDPSIHLADIPKHFGTLYADINPVEWLHIIPTMDARSNSYYSTSGSERNSGYALYGLKFSFTPASLKYVSFNVGAENIFNKNYAKYDASYASPGRYIYSNIRVDFY